MQSGMPMPTLQLRHHLSPCRLRSRPSASCLLDKLGRIPCAVLDPLPCFGPFISDAAFHSSWKLNRDGQTETGS
jgi:hypothetical protein